MVPLAAQRDAQHGMSAREFRIERDRLAKLGGGEIEFAELAFDQAEFEVEFGGGFDGESFLELRFGGRRIVLLEIDSSDEIAGADVGGIELNSGSAIP